MQSRQEGMVLSLYLSASHPVMICIWHGMACAACNTCSVAFLLIIKEPSTLTYTMPGLCRPCTSHYPRMRTTIPEDAQS